MTVSPDRIDRIRAEWAESLPNLDTSSLSVTGRVLDLAASIGRRADRALQAQGLGMGEFALLASLRRVDRGEGLTPTEITEATMVTAGTTTQRLQGLENAGLVSRGPDPQDRRARRVHLTPDGRRRAELAIRAVTDAERSFLADMPARDQQAVARILRTFAITAEAPGHGDIES